MSEWSALPAEVAEISPDLVVILFDQFLQNNPQAAIEAHELLHESRVPSLVVLGDNTARQRRIAEMVAGFEVILEPPFDESQIAAALVQAMEQHPPSELSLAESGDYAAVTIAKMGPTSLDDGLPHRDLWPDEEELWFTPAPGQEVDGTGPGVEQALEGPPPPISTEDTEPPSTPTDQIGHPVVIDVPLDALGSDSALEPAPEPEPEPEPGVPPMEEELDLSDLSKVGTLAGAEHTEPNLGDDAPATDWANAGLVEEELDVRDWTDTVYEPPSEDPRFDSAISTDPRTDDGPEAFDETIGEPVVGSEVVTVQLPELTRGSLTETPALRVFFGHWVMGGTGRLVLKMGRISREIGFAEGTPGLVDAQIIDPATRNRVLASLVWSDGTYSFHEERLGEERFCAFGDPFELIHSAIHQGLSLNQVIAPLTGELKRFPTRTTRVHENGGSVERLGTVRKFLDSCGQRNLETIAGTMSDGMEQTLKDALFCYYSGLICFTDAPKEGPVELRIEASARTLPPNSRSSTSAVPTGNLDEEQIMTELSRLIRQFQGMTPYQVFEIEPGAGRNVVKERYYQLVKDHHPDTYALARSTDIQPMAEMVFRMIREAYGSLMKSEKSDRGTRRPSGAYEAMTSSSPPPRESPSPGAGGAGSYAMGRSSDIGVDTVAGPAGPTPGVAASAGSPPPTHGSARSDERSEAAKPVKSNPPRRKRSARRRNLSGQTDGPTTTQRRKFNRSGSGRIMARVKSDAGVEMDPRQLFKTGTTLLGSGSNERALKAFEKALEKDPENATYLAHYAWSMYLVDTEKASKVTKLLRDAIKQGQGSGLEWPTLFLGHLMTAEGQAKEGVEYYEQCLQANPNNIEAKRRLRLHDMRKTTGSFLDKLFKPKKKKKK